MIVSSTMTTNPVLGYYLAYAMPAGTTALNLAREVLKPGNEKGATHKQKGQWFFVNLATRYEQGDDAELAILDTPYTGRENWVAALYEGGALEIVRL